MEKYYKISEGDLKYFIRCRAKLEALEAGGVDNWSWYGDSIHDYLIDMAKEYKIDTEEDFIDFDDIANREIQSFKEVDSYAK